MKNTFLFLVTFAALDTHGAQNPVFIPPITKVTAVFINNKDVQELFRIEDISYGDLTKLMNIFIQQTGYIAGAADIFDAKTNFLFLVAKLSVDGPTENNLNATSKAAELFCNEREKKGIPLPNPSELILMMNSQPYQMAAYSPRK